MKPTFKAQPVQVQVPASSANLGPGFVEKHLQRCHHLWPVVGAYLSPKREWYFVRPYTEASRPVEMSIPVSAFVTLTTVRFRGHTPCTWLPLPGCMWR
jgi:hypothetical protein